MLFDSMTSDDFKFLVGSLIVGGLLYGWAMDLILGRSSFGVLPTTGLAIGMSYVGLMGMDWAVQHHHVPPDYISPLGYLTAATLSVTLSLVCLIILRRIVAR